MVADESCNTIGRIDTTNNQEMVAELVCDSLTLSNTTMMRINMRVEKMEHILDPKANAIAMWGIYPTPESQPK